MLVLFALQKVSLVPVVKITIAIDEKIWDEFGRTVSNRYGVLRNLSGVVDDAIRNYNMVEVLRESATKLCVDPEYPSSREVEQRRPSISGGSAVLREMREGRRSRLHGP